MPTDRDKKPADRKRRRSTVVRDAAVKPEQPPIEYRLVFSEPEHRISENKVFTVVEGPRRERQPSRHIVIATHEESIAYALEDIARALGALREKHGSLVEAKEAWDLIAPLDAKAAEFRRNKGRRQRAADRLGSGSVQGASDNSEG